MVDLDHTPVVPPPPGHQSNFDNPESQSYKLIIVVAVMTSLTLLFTGGRVYTRLKITRTFGADDCKSFHLETRVGIPAFLYICIAAAVVVLACNIDNLFLCGGVDEGINGVHLYDVTLRQWIRYSKMGIANSVLLRVANTLIKVGFFVFYLRLFGPKSHIRIMVWVGIGVVVTWCSAFVIGYLVTALPHDSDFLSSEYRARLSDVPQKLITTSVWMSVMTDFYTLIIPLHQIPNLGLSYKRKWGISVIFLTGLMATGAGIANLVFRHNKSVMDFTDVTWTGVYVTMTSLLENNLGVVCLSMPVVLALFVGRVTAFGESIGSWVNVRKAQRHGAGDSASDLAASDGNESAPESVPSLPAKQVPDPKLGGMRKFIRNLHRSRAQDSLLGHNNTTVMSTFNDLTSADFSYHAQLKTLHPTPTRTASYRSSKGEKLG